MNFKYLFLTTILILSSEARCEERIYLDKASPVIKNEMAIEAYNVFKLSITAQYYTNIYLSKKFKDYSKSGGKRELCISYKVYKKIHNSSYDRFLKETPSELLANAVLWTASKPGIKVKETGLLDVVDPVVVKSMTENIDIKNLLKYLSSAVYSELNNLPLSEIKIASNQCDNFGNK